MVSNITKLGLGSIILILFFSCQNVTKNISKKLTDTCNYYRYDAGQIVSNLGCKNCHLRMTVDEKDEYGSPTFIGLASMDSLKLIDYAFTKKHKGWYGNNGNFRTTRMDTLSDCQIKSVIRYIKDAARNIPIPTH